MDNIESIKTELINVTDPVHKNSIDDNFNKIKAIETIKPKIKKELNCDLFLLYNKVMFNKKYEHLDIDLDFTNPTPDPTPDPTFCFETNVVTYDLGRFLGPLGWLVQTFEKYFYVGLSRPLDSTRFARCCLYKPSYYDSSYNDPRVQKSHTLFSSVSYGEQERTYIARVQKESIDFFQKLKVVIQDPTTKDLITVWEPPRLAGGRKRQTRKRVKSRRRYK